MLNIIIKSMSHYLIIAGVLGAVGLTIPVYYSIMILAGFIGVELNTDESYTAIYFNTKQEEE